jgi:hypothetical protein
MKQRRFQNLREAYTASAAVHRITINAARLKTPIVRREIADGGEVPSHGQERQRECAQRQQQRNGGIAVREESLRDMDREISVDGDIVPFERVAD